MKLSDTDPFGNVAPGPIVRSVFNYWKNLTIALGHLPSRKNIDPLAIAESNHRALSHIWLLDVERNPYRFRYRLIGHWLRHAGALCRVGDYVDQFVDESQGDNLQVRLIAVAEGRLPDFRSGAPRLPHDDYVSKVQRLSLPLSADGNLVDAILCVSDYEWTSASRNVLRE